MPRSILWAFGLALFLGGGIAVALGVFLGLQESRYESEGAEAQGRVTGREFREDPEDDDHDYILLYEFTPSTGGDRIEGQSEVSAEYWEERQAGHSVEIQYLPDDPAVSRIAGTGDWLGPILAGVLGGVGVAIGAVLLLFAWRGAARERRLLAVGIPVSAEIVSHERTSYEVNDVAQWRVVYQYADPLGRTHLGRSPHMDPHAAHQWQVGTSVPVRYDPMQPETSIWTPRR